MYNKTSETLAVAMTLCYYCQEGVAMMNKWLTPRSAEIVNNMHNCVINMEPCQKCKEFMKNGIILISISDAMSTPGWNVRKGEDWFPNPYRTGGWWVVKSEAIKRIFTDDIAEFALKHRFAFIEHECAVKLGLFKAYSEDN